MGALSLLKFCKDNYAKPQSIILLLSANLTELVYKIVSSNQVSWVTKNSPARFSKSVDS